MAHADALGAVSSDSGQNGIQSPSPYSVLNSKFRVALTGRFDILQILQMKGGSMTGYFRRQLADYVEYHRDPWNCTLHVFGIIFLFLAAILPLTMWSISVFGVQTAIAALAVLPVLTYWLVLDVSLGVAIAGAACLLLWTARMIVDHASFTGIWITTAVLIIIGIASQIVGHRIFERRQPALVDNPSHLLLGPMFVMAKLFIALGLRDDLAVIIGPIPQHAPSGETIYAAERRSKPLTRS